MLTPEELLEMEVRVLVAEVRRLQGLLLAFADVRWIWGGRVIIRYLPDGRRVFLPQIKVVCGYDDEINQLSMDLKWHPVSSARIWDMPLTKEEIGACMRVWRQIFPGVSSIVEAREAMATWGVRCLT